MNETHCVIGSIPARFLKDGDWVDVNGIARQLSEVIHWPGTLRVSANYWDSEAGRIDVAAYDYDEMVPIGTPLN